MAEKVPIFNDPVQLEVRNQVIKLESDEIVKTRKDIEILDSDISTTRRQVEIIQDSSLRKANTIFLLKTTLTYLSLIFIPLLLALKDMISWQIVSYIVAILTVIYAIIIFYNLRSVMSRDSNRFSLRYFGKSMKPSSKPVKCVSNSSNKLTPEQRELEEKIKQLGNLDSQLKIIEERRKELDNKRKDLTSETTTLEAKFNAQYPNDVLNKEIEKNLAMRSRF